VKNTVHILLFAFKLSQVGIFVYQFVCYHFIAYESDNLGFEVYLLQNW